jgi:hypothetical protein
MKKGSRHSMESRLKISAALRTKEVREKILAGNVDQKRTPQTRQNISKGLKRHWAPQEVRDRQWRRLKRLQQLHQQQSQ